MHTHKHLQMHFGLLPKHRNHQYWRTLDQTGNRAFPSIFNDVQGPCRFYHPKNHAAHAGNFWLTRTRTLIATASRPAATNATQASQKRATCPTTDVWVGAHAAEFQTPYTTARKRGKKRRLRCGNTLSRMPKTWSFMRFASCASRPHVVRALANSLPTQARHGGIESTKYTRDSLLFHGLPLLVRLARRGCTSVRINPDDIFAKHNRPNA